MKWVISTWQKNLIRLILTFWKMLYKLVHHNLTSPFLIYNVSACLFRLVYSGLFCMRYLIKSLGTICFCKAPPRRQYCLHWQHDSTTVYRLAAVFDPFSEASQVILRNKQKEANNCKWDNVIFDPGDVHIHLELILWLFFFFANIMCEGLLVPSLLQGWASFFSQFFVSVVEILDCRNP